MRIRQETEFKESTESVGQLHQGRRQSADLFDRLYSKETKAFASYRTAVKEARCVPVIESKKKPIARRLPARKQKENIAPAAARTQKPVLKCKFQRQDESIHERGRNQTAVTSSQPSKNSSMRMMTSFTSCQSAIPPAGNQPKMAKIPSEKERTWGEYQQLVRDFRLSQQIFEDTSTSMASIVSSTQACPLAQVHAYSPGRMQRARSFSPKSWPAFRREQNPPENVVTFRQREPSARNVDVETPLSEDEEEEKIRVRNSILAELAERKGNMVCELEQLSPCGPKKRLSKPAAARKPVGDKTRSSRVQCETSCAGGVTNVMERSLIWKKLKDSKIKQMQHAMRDRDMGECTFRPRRVTENSSLARPYEEAAKRKGAGLSMISKRPLEPITNLGGEREPGSYGQLYRMKRLAGAENAGGKLSPIRGASDSQFQFSTTTAAECHKLLFAD